MKYGIAPSWDADRLDDMERAAFLVALWLRVRELSGKGRATKEEMLERLPIQERTLDGALAQLNRQGLLVKA